MKMVRYLVALLSVTCAVALNAEAPAGMRMMPMQAREQVEQILPDVFAATVIAKHAQDTIKTELPEAAADAAQAVNRGEEALARAANFAAGVAQ